MPASILVVLLMGLAGWLRITGLPQEAPWSDELASYRHLGEPSLLAYLSAERAGDGPMVPLYFVLQYFWAHAVGDSVVSVRMLSIVFGVLLVPVMYLLGARLFGREAGLLAALLVALNAMHVQYSQEIRMYSLTFLLAACSVYTLLRVRDDGRYWWAMHVAVNSCLIFTHLFAVLLLPAEALFVLLYFRGQRRVLLWFVLQMLLAAPLLAWMQSMPIQHLREVVTWVPGISLESVGTMVSWYTGAGGFQVRDSVPSFLLMIDIPLKAACVLVYVLACVAGGRALARTRHTGWSLLFLWLAVPVACAAFITVVLQPIFAARYLGFVSLPLHLLLAAAVFGIPGASVRRTCVVLVIALFSTQALILLLSRPIRSDWYGVVAQIQRENATLPVLINGTVPADHPLIAMGQLETVVGCREAVLERVDSVLARGENLWVVYDPRFHMDPLVLEQHLDASKVRFRRQDFAGRHGPLVLYLCGGRAVPGDNS